MLARHEENVPESFGRQMSPFRHDLFDAQRDAQDRIIARKPAVTAVVDALVRQIERREQPHRSAEILEGVRMRLLRERFQLRVRFRQNEVAEPPRK